jgi:hypothetical protein
VRTALLFGKGCANLVSGSATRESILPRALELEGAWRVEYFDSDGAGYVAIFAGQSAEVRALSLLKREAAQNLGC